MRQWKKGVGVLCVMALLSTINGCSQSPVRNPLAGRSEPKLGALPIAAKKQAEAKVAWSSGALGKTQRYSKLTPYLAGNTLYGADYHGKLAAFDKSTGKIHWQIKSRKKFLAGPVLIGQTLLLTTADAKVMAYSANGGKLLWEAKATSEVLAPPSGTPEVLIIQAMDGSISALSMHNGETQWRVDQTTPALTLRASGAPVVNGDKVFVGVSSGKLLALNIHTGVIEWERSISEPRGRSELQRMVDITATPIVKQGNVYVITYQGKLAAISSDTGNTIWERELSSYQNITSDNTHLYVTDSGHTVWAINLQDGSIHWKQPALEERYITGPGVMNDTVVVGDRGGVVHFLSTHNGSLLYSLDISGKIYQNPISGRNEVFLNKYNGTIVAIKKG